VVRQPAPAGGKPLLFVAEVFLGAARAGDEPGAVLVGDARRIATLASPNLARVKEVATQGDDLVVYGELVDGEKLQELWRPDGLPLEIALRAIVDALTGLGALHNLRDAKQQPLKLVHGELSPATILLGLDGTARVLHSIARCAPGAQPDPQSVGYMAPEVLEGDVFNQRADVFSAGVMLWEALTGKRLVDERDPAAAAARFRSEPIPPATVPDKAPWAKGLVDAAARALAISPDGRWPTAAMLAAEIRKSAGLKLAPASTAGAFTKSALGERVKARRARLEAHEASPLPARAEAPAKEEANDVFVAPGIRAPVEEVIELGFESMMELPPRVPPHAAAPAPGAPAASPPPNPLNKSTLLGIPAPVVAPPPPVASPRPDIVTPLMPMAVDETPPPTSPSPIRQAEAFEREERADRTRKGYVLGGVGLLGAAILVLALVHVVHRPSQQAAAAQPATAAAIAPAPPPPAAPPPVAPPPAAPPPQSAAPPTPATAKPGRPAPATPVAAAAKPKPRPTSPPAPRPKKKPSFDPKTL
jgi:serine/threonine-protein kinase